MNENPAILIVDDTAANLQVLGNMLRKNSYNVAGATSGEEALAFVKERLPDLILLDIMMPGIDGFEVCKRLQKKEELKQIPVIFISALTDIENKLEGFAVGGVDYITKPFQKEEVLARVKNHLELKNAKREIKRKREEHAMLLDNIETQIWYLKEEGVYGAVNQSHAQFMGFKKEELENRALSEFLSKEEWETSIFNNREAFTKKKIIKSEEWLTNIRGELRLLFITRTPKLDQQGEVEYVICSADDITAEKKLKDKLKYRIELENFILNLSKDFINLKDENIESSISLALERVAKFIGVDYGYIYLFSDNQQEIIESYKWKSELFEDENGVIDNHGFHLQDFNWVLEQLNNYQVVNITELEQLPKTAKNERKILESQQIKSALMIPIVYSNDLIGVLGFNSIEQKRTWQEEEIQLFEVVADIFVNALDKKKQEEQLSNYYIELELRNMEVERLYSDLDNEFEKASKLHQQFLPNTLPQIDGISYSTYFQPAAKLGGDFYDLIQIEGQLIVYLADVSGHGLDGSMLNIFLRETINSYLLYEHQNIEKLNPGKIIEFIALRYREEDFSADYFICLLLGILDLDTNKFNFANAGFQIAPISIRRNGEIIDLNCGGMPITTAVDEDSIQELRLLDYEVEELFMEQGDAIFLTTDGLIEEVAAESTENYDHYGEKRLKNVLAKNYSLPPELIIHKIKEDFIKFSGSLVANDDLTFILLKREVEIIAQFEKKINSSCEEIYQFQEELFEFIAPYYDTIICVGFQELLTNAVEHGNQLDKAKIVDIKIEVTEQYIKASIEDEGSGFNWRTKINQELNIEEDFESERGRGIKISNKLYDQLWYNEQGNQVNILNLR